MSSKDTVGKTLVVAGGLCLVCSILVSTLAVSLKPIQTRNKILDRKKNILAAAGLYVSDETIDEIYAGSIKPMVVDMQTGEYLQDKDAESVDSKAVAKDPSTSITLARDQDLGGIKRRGNHTVVYEVFENDQFQSVVLPVYGKGLWSTLYGFLAVSADGNTIDGLGFYEHAETPGLGGEIDNPMWKAQWKGKKIFGETGELKVEVVKGIVNAEGSDAIHQVDGLSGATITARGVHNLLHFWLGNQGFDKYLIKIRERGVENG